MYMLALADFFISLASFGGDLLAIATFAGVPVPHTWISHYLFQVRLAFNSLPMMTQFLMASPFPLIRY
jgi:hypothetical protein